MTYLTEYLEGEPPSESRHMPGVELCQAKAMFPGIEVLSESGRLVVLNLGGRQRVALSDYSFTHPGLQAPDAD